MGGEQHGRGFHWIVELPVEVFDGGDADHDADHFVGAFNQSMLLGDDAAFEALFGNVGCYVVPGPAVRMMSALPQLRWQSR